MKEELVIEIKAIVNDFNKKMDGVIDKVEDLDTGVKDLDKQTKKAGKAFDVFKKSSPVMQKLNSLTGGLASSMVEVVSGLGKATAGAKAFRAVLISTGIGALVVAIGAIVAYWDDIVKYVTGYDNALQDSIDSTKKAGDEAQRIADNYKDSTNTLKLQGKTQQEINKGLIFRLGNTRILRADELKLLKTQLEGVKDYRKAWEGYVDSTQKIFIGLFGRIAKGFDTIFGSNLEKKLKDLAKTSKEWVLDFVADTTEIDTAIKGLDSELIKLQNEIDGLRLKNIKLDADEKKEAEKIADQLQKELDKQKALLVKIEFESFEGEEIFDVSAINDIAVASGYASDMINQKKSFDVEGIEDGFIKIKNLEKAIKQFNKEFKDVLNPKQLASASRLSIEQLEAFGNSIRKQQKRFDEFKQSFGDIIDPEILAGLTNASIEQLDLFAQKLNTTLLIADEVASGVANLVGEAFSFIADTFETGNKFFDAILNTIIGIFSQIASALLTNLIVEKIIGTGKKAVAFGVAQANAITTATQTAVALGPVGLGALPGLIATATGIVAGAFGAISAFSTGGFSGDKNIIRVNGNELILNPNQQSTLFNMLRGTIPSSMSGTTRDTSQSGSERGEWRVKGSDLVLVLDRAQRKSNRFG